MLHSCLVYVADDLPDGSVSISAGGRLCAMRLSHLWPALSLSLSPCVRPCVSAGRRRRQGGPNPEIKIAQDELRKTSLTPGQPSSRRGSLVPPEDQPRRASIIIADDVSPASATLRPVPPCPAAGTR